MTGLGVISGTAADQPPLPPCRVGNWLHSISSRFKVHLGWLANAYKNLSIHPRWWGGVEGDGSSHKAKGFNSGMQGDDYGGGIMEVAMLGFDLALIIIVGSSTQLCSF